MRFALAGNPNSGKTTMFNALTGKNEKVGNWAGVTVDKKENALKKSFGIENVTVVDLPGAYSMSPFTAEESVTKDYIVNENPDVIINIVDSTNLSRSLFFTTQLLELGVPVVVALNKTDINRKKKTFIDIKLLSEKLGCPVVETVSTSSDGLQSVIDSAFASVGKAQFPPYSDSRVNVHDKLSARRADAGRYFFVNGIVRAVEKRTVFTNKRNAQDKIDDVITSRWVGIPIFAVVMFLVFWISQAGPGAWIADWLTALLEKGQNALAEILVDATPIVSALLVDGVVGGAIAVIGFLPLVMIMYFLIALLEDCGYMARASVVLDPIFKKVGLSGKSVIPFVVGTGCAVPGVMACRTIRDERERRATAMLAPFMPCGAKLPVISLFAGAFFEDATWVGPLMYFAGIIIILIGAVLVNAVTGNRAKNSFFIIELPEYKVPSVKRAFFSMCQRGWSYIVKAATIILLCNTVVQIMQSFNWSFQVAESADASILASIAGPFAYVLVPVVGVLSWQLAAAAVTGFIAKENVVGTLAVCFVGLDNLIDAEEFSILEGAGTEVVGIMAISKAAALAYLMFNLFSPPCFAAIGAMRSEMKSAKWLIAGISLQLATGFTVAFIVYQAGTLITTGSLGEAFIPGLIAVLSFAVIIAFLCYKADKKVKLEKSIKKRKSTKIRMSE